MDSNPNSRQIMVLLLQIFLVMILALGAFSVFALSRYMYAVDVPEPTAVTTGKVTSMKYIPARRAGHYECSVTFVVLDQPHYINRAPCLWTGVGDDISVIYQITHPDRADIDNRLFWDIFGIVGVLFVIIAYFLFRKIRKLSKDSEQMNSESIC
jgi:hypothetical protein